MTAPTEDPLVAALARIVRAIAERETVAQATEVAAVELIVLEVDPGAGDEDPCPA